MRLTLSKPEREDRALGVTLSALFAGRLTAAPMGKARGVSLLLLSTAFAEVASNIAYVVLVERAYELGKGVTAIGIVLILQAVAQVVFGSWAGAVADRWGFRKVASMSAIVTIPLLLALAIAKDISVVYASALLLMVARSLLIPARFGLTAQLSEKSRLAETNTALLILAGAGSFVGPAMAAALLAAADGFGPSLMVAGTAWLLSVPPLVLIRLKPEKPHANRRPSFLEEVRTGWRLIRKRTTVMQVLTCLLIAAFFLGAITPLFTPLSRQLGLGAEGTGIFFSALGFGYLIGPAGATVLFKRMRLSSALLIAGLLAPIGLVLVGAIEHLVGVLIAIALVSIAGSGINVIVTTVTQRLTPPAHRGTVLGTEQTLIGLAWIASLGVITTITAIWEAESNIRMLFVALGSIGFMSILGCWLWNKRPLQLACARCEARLRLAPLACGALQSAPFGLSSAACGILCGEECQCCA